MMLSRSLGGWSRAVLLVAGVILVACGSPQATAPIPDWRTDSSEPYPFTTPVPPLEATPIDGVYTRDPTDSYAGSRAPCVRCPPYPLDRGESTLILERGRFEMLHVEPRYRGSGHYRVEGDLLVVFNDAECTHQRGEYRWSIDDGVLQLTLIDDPCAYGQRGADLTHHPWRAMSGRGRCQPPDEEAAVTGHWPVPSGC